MIFPINSEMSFERGSMNGGGTKSKNDLEYFWWVILEKKKSNHEIVLTWKWTVQSYFE